MSAARVPVARVGGRLLLLDPLDRLLLIYERLEGGSTHWLTPGGGVEADEDPRAAAVREAFEEVGIEVVLPVDAEPVLQTRRLWSWGGTTFDQVDHFFLVRLPDTPDPRPQGLTEVERQTVLGHRWWSRAQLRDTTETVVPADLFAVLERVAAAPR